MCWDWGRWMPAEAQWVHGLLCIHLLYLYSYLGMQSKEMTLPVDSPYIQQCWISFPKGIWELKHIGLPGCSHQFNYLCILHSCYIKNIPQCFECSGLIHSNVNHAMEILHIRQTVLPLGRSGERGWTSLARCWLHCSLPDGKAQMLWGVKRSGKERNGIAKEAALTLKPSKSVMHCVGPAPKAQEISYPTYVLPGSLSPSCAWVWSPRAVAGTGCWLCWAMGQGLIHLVL